MIPVPAIATHVSFSTDRPSAYQRNSCVRISRSCYLDADYLMSHIKPWERDRVVMVARILACQRQKRNATVVGSAAAMLHGLGTLVTVQDIDVVGRCSRGRGRSGPVFPPAVVGGRTIVESCSVVVRSSRATAGMETTTLRGARVIGVEDAVVSSALIAPGPGSFVVTCEALRRLSMFSRQKLDLSRMREADARGTLIRHLDRVPARTKNRAWAKWALQRADGACDSVAEELLLYLLHRHGFDGVSTQHMVGHRTGKYFIDAALPNHMIAIEFDGVEKYGDRPEIQLEVMEEERVREEALIDMGWTVIRARWADLQRPTSLLKRIQSAM